LAKNPFYSGRPANPFYRAPNSSPAYHPQSAPAASVAAPTAAASSGTNALPFNATSQANIAAANNTFNIQDLGPGGFQYQLGQLDFNYNSPLNPFNQARMLQRAYQQANGRNLNSYAARQQLYSGAYQNAANDANFNYQRSSAAAQQAYQNAKNRILQARNVAQANVDNTTAVTSGNALAAKTTATAGA